MGPLQPHRHHHPRRLRPGTACTTCRRRKLRCSGTPNCERCAANHLKCVLDGDLFFKTYGPNTFLTKTTSPSTSGGGMTLPSAAALTLRLSFKQQHTPLHTSVRQVLRPHHTQPQLQQQEQQQQQQQEYGQQHPYRSQPQLTVPLHGPQGRGSRLDDESSSSKEFCPEEGPESQDENWSRGEDDDNDNEEEDEDEDYDKESTLANRYHHHQHPEAIPPEPFAVPKPKKWTMRIENLLS